MNTHFPIKDIYIDNLVRKLQIQIYTEAVSLYVSINLFTGDYELSLSESSILHWCESIFLEIRDLIKNECSIQEKLEQFHIYCMLYSISKNYMQTYPNQRFVYSYYGNSFIHSFIHYLTLENSLTHS